MANFQANSTFDFNAFMAGNTLGNFFANATVTTDFASWVTFTYETSPGVFQVLTLTGTFGDFIGNNPTTGTVNGMDYSVTGGTDFSITGANVPVPTFNYYGSNGDLKTLFGITFQGDDSVYGSDGNDTIASGYGNDLLDGKGGADVMAGSTGNDTYIVNSAYDYVYELAGEGIDSVKASVSFTLQDNVEKLTLTGSASSGTGNALANTITGQGAANTLNGMDGNDILLGLNGNDTLNGGLGADRLTGGTGRDTLTGGGGRDTFIFGLGSSGSTRTSADDILDFKRVQGDKIDLHALGTLTFIGTAAFGSHAGEVRYVQDAGHTYVAADLDGNGTADFMLDLTGTINLQSTDFIF